MAEVLGILASTAQLTDYALKISAAISEIHSRVQGGPELQKYAVQIQELLNTTAEIEQNHDFYSSLVLRRLDSVTEEARSLLTLLEGLSANYTRGSLTRRYLKAARGGKAEKKIGMSFKRLEQEKTSLIFCISVSNTEQLCSINNGVQILVESSHSLNSSPAISMQATESTQRGLLPMKCPQGHMAQTLATTQNSIICPTCRVDLVLETSHRDPDRDVLMDCQQGNQPSQSSEMSDAIFNERSYDGCTILGQDNQANQMNGNLGNDIAGIQRYKNCTVTGSGKQMNGSASGDAAVQVAKNFFTGFGGSVLNGKNHNVG